MRYTCIIVDDEQHATEQLLEYVENTPTLYLIKAFTDPELALHEIMQMKTPVDILFTDVEMPKISGIDLVMKLSHEVKATVFVTAHLKYALDGYEVNVNNFLLKPYTFQKFKSVILSVINQLSRDNPFIFLKNKYKRGFIKIYTSEITFIEAAGNYVVINGIHQPITTLLKLSETEKRLEIYSHFIRIHKSFIVSTKHIEKFKDDFVYLRSGESIPVGSTYKEKVTNYFKSRLIP
ncbi:DNA-binding response regulator [Pedobacter chinensis]|uniref:DNA-binding response regulator n=1 Tax=Pedobacter chinensis TaxID=2282421 RepID=A0A369Q4S4_9SPHI|nr:LytTR family DNA-binding domain-containing protein [Pedobacter chinensis]RDC57308.1 DNA-binding response regulator [Pedobacter chinensis]